MPSAIIFPYRVFLATVFCVFKALEGVCCIGLDDVYSVFFFAQPYYHEYQVASYSSSNISSIAESTKKHHFGTKSFVATYLSSNWTC